MVFVYIIFVDMAFVQSKEGLRRHLSSAKWPSSSPKIVFVEIIFAKMAFAKSKNGLRRDYLRQNGLRQVQEWSSSRLSSPKWASSSPRMVFVDIIFADMTFV